MRSFKFFLLIATIIFAGGVSCSCCGGLSRGTVGSSDSTDSTLASDSVRIMRRYEVRVVAELPHSSGAYTQGLLVDDGRFVESTGLYGESSLRRVEVASGEVLQNVLLEPRFFGEGVTLLNGKLYQLTWLEGVCFVYDATSFERIAQYTYSGEGWGITTDGSLLYTSDGSHRVSVRDPQSFDVVRTISVRSDQGYLRNINELEWIDGKIWANVYMSDVVVIIDPVKGVVEGVVDCGALKERLGNRAAADVLNGIARDYATGYIYLTGKLWDKVFQVELESV